MSLIQNFPVISGHNGYFKIVSLPGGSVSSADFQCLAIAFSDDAG
jgi:hypothetical protein